MINSFDSANTEVKTFHRDVKGDNELTTSIIEGNCSQLTGIFQTLKTYILALILHFITKCRQSEGNL